MPELDDQQLVAEYLKGNAQAFDVLVQRHINGLYNFVYKYTHDLDQAEDVTQQAFVKAWKNLKKFDSKYKFKTWLYTIAKNTALDALKKQGFLPITSEETMDLDVLLDHSPLPEQILSRIEDTDNLNISLQSLDDKYRKVLTMYYFEGLNFREIAEELGESIDTVKTRHRRAILNLRKIWQD